MNRFRRTLLRTAALVALAPGLALAQSDTVKIGLILPMTGPFASTGRQIEAAARLYMAAERRDRCRQEDRADRQGRHGNAGHRQAARAGAGGQRQGSGARGLRPDADRDGGSADRDAGEGAGSRDGRGLVDDHRSLAVHRAHELHGGAVGGADGRVGDEERHQEGRDARLRLRAGASTRRRRSASRSSRRAARSRTCACRCAIRTSRRSCSARPTRSPTRCSCSCRPAQGSQLMKQYSERGLDKSGIKLIGPGDMTDDDILNDMGDVALGTITTQFYSAAHPVRRTRRTSRRSRRRTKACARTSCRSAVTTACISSTKR